MLQSIPKHDVGLLFYLLVSTFFLKKDDYLLNNKVILKRLFPRPTDVSLIRKLQGENPDHMNNHDGVHKK